MNKPVDPAISKYMSDIGRLGRGKSKVRGDKSYYQKLVKIREEKRKDKENKSML